MARLTQVVGALVRWGLGACALCLILLALYVSLGRQLLPMLNDYRPVLASRASQALGMPVEIGRLEGAWGGLAPVLVARDVTLGSGPGALHLDRVRAVPGIWRSLVSLEPHIATLQVEGLQLTLEQGSDGQWALQGLPRRQDDAPLDPGQAFARLRQLGELTLLDSQLILKPWQQDPLAFTYLGLSLRATLGEERLDLRFNLPDGKPVAAQLKARVPEADWRAATVQAYLSLPQSDWARWLPAGMTGQWHFNALQAGGELWLDWAQRRLETATLRLNAPHIQGGITGRAAAPLDDLALNAWVQRDGEGYKAVAQPLAMSLGGQRWETTLKASQAGDQWQLQASRIELAPLLPLLDAYAPWPEKAALAVDSLKPTGALRNVQVTVSPHEQGDRRLAFAANLEQVAFEPYHNAPGAANVSGSISGDLGQGELRLASDNFMLFLWPIFKQPWHYQQAHARLTWQLNSEGFSLVAPVIQVLGEEGKIAADFMIRLPFGEGLEPYMDLRVGLHDGDGRYTPKYLPEALSPQVADWLRAAVQQGKVNEGYFQYQGSLAHAAPDHARSLTLFFDVSDATLAFEPGWPAVTGVDGKVYIQDGDVRIDASRGRLLDTAVNDVQVRVPHAPEGQVPRLFVKGGFEGPLSDGVKILQTAPIGTGELFAGWEGDGPLRGAVDLDIPLAHGLPPKVVVDFNTSGARLKIAEPALEISQLKGAFRFDLDKGLAGQEVSGQALGKPFTASLDAAGKTAAPLTQVNVNGRMDVATLSTWLGNQQSLPASGEFPYQLKLSLGQDSQLSIDSDLKGASVDLPLPYGKAAGDSRPTHLELGLQGNARQLRVGYAGLASLIYQPASGQFASPLAAGRGELLLGDGTPRLPDATGLRVRGAMDWVDLKAWQAVRDRYMPAAATATPGTSGGAGAALPLSAADVTVAHLSAFGQSLEQARLRLERASNAWSLRVDSPQVTGTATLADSATAPLDIDLQEVHLPAPPPEVANAPEPPETPDPLADVDPHAIPAVNVRIVRLWQGDDLVGAWSLKLRPTDRGLALNDLDLGLKGMQLQGNGGWEGSPGASTSWFKGAVHGSNLADVLKAWRFAPSVTSHDFALDVDGRWPGSPAWASPKRYSGSLDATLNQGQFVEVEGGAQALRVFGLLNFNAIGRRLRLDFSDLLGRGLSYDKVTGKLAASEGVYVTRTPISLTGPSSNLELDGTLDMAADRVDARLLVTLPVSNNLPIAALIVGAPAIGGALFLVDKLLGDRVSRLMSVKYRVEGPLKEPKLSFDRPFDKSH
ncbi:YhdP family protein [Pseudomonas sp. RIT-PI-S]|uniref:YhdP family protein n=1 Tax=Pseudomonas sp. RIT-PI-S TaxID=3035295 RepID=UPI0021DB4ED8|nr:YhdP family protein [Pseudomonas sp. RIT-PI-S]